MAPLCDQYRFIRLRFKATETDKPRHQSPATDHSQTRTPQRPVIMPDEKHQKSKATVVDAPQKVKFEVYGEEMLEKKVKSSGNSGRVYLPPNWVGHNVKIIRID
jgi:putative transposon-encoded protein